MDFLRGAICSIVDGHARKREFSHYHFHLQEAGQSPEDGLQLFAPRDAAADVELLDLKGVFFNRLRQIAPERLSHTITQWETVFLWADAIPNVPNARCAYHVRQMARTIMMELGIGPRRRRKQEGAPRTI
jgi:hypothetical protein